MSNCASKFQTLASPTKASASVFTMKKLLKKFLPQFILSSLRKSLQKRLLFELFKLDTMRYLKATRNSSCLTKIESNISKNTHVIEKGLTMPSMRYGFGQDRINALIENIKLYNSYHYDVNRFQISHATSVLLEYIATHDKANYQLDAELKKEIISVSHLTNTTTPSQQLSQQKEDYFEHINDSFDLFSSSRHSVRDYAEGEQVDIKVIDKAIKLANNAPSSCNRQPSRTYIVQNKSLIKQILDLQNGNRGFGHLCDKLIVLTADCTVYGSPQERNSPYIDGGMYGMNLLYALHFYKIATCTLNCYFDKKTDTKLRQLLNIPEHECFIFILPIGKAPDHFKTAISRRNDYQLTYQVK